MLHWAREAKVPPEVGFLGALVALVLAIEVLIDEQSRHELIDDLLSGSTRAVTIWEPGSRPTVRSAERPRAS